MIKAYSYLRFSTPEQQKGDSFRRQTALASDYASRHGLELDTALTLQDLGVSAFRGKNARTGALRTFLDAVHDGHIEEGSYLLVESLDRISRDAILAAQGLFLEIIDAGVVLVTLTDQRAYSKASINANPTDLIISLVSMMRAHDESAIKSRRLKAVWSAKRAEGSSRPLTSRAPAWLRLKDGAWEVVKERADVVRRVFALTAEGHGQHSIASLLNKEGVPTFGDAGRRPAAHWHRSYLVKLLDSPAVVGTFVPHIIEHVDRRRIRKAQEPIENYFPPIVDADCFEAVQALRMDSRSPQRGRHAGQAIQNFLGGLATCPWCRGTMTRAAKGSRSRPYLICARAKAGGGCIYRAVRLDRVEEVVRANAGLLAEQVPAAEGEMDLQSKVSAIQAAIDAAEEQLENLVTGVARGSVVAVDDRMRDLEASIEELRAHEKVLWDRIGATHGPLLERRVATVVEALEADPFDPGRANVALRQVLSRVVVDYRTGQLELEWLHGGASSLLFAWPEEDGQEEAA